jgi:hypothetical protein
MVRELPQEFPMHNALATRGPTDNKRYADSRPKVFMRRFFHWKRLLPAVVLVLVASAIGVYLYCRSDSAARLVQEKLEDRLGMPTEFDSMSVGISETTINGLRIREADSPTAEPFVAVAKADVDVAAVGAVRGDSPKSMRLHDAAVLLRFNKNGDLLTKLPKAGSGDGELPTIRIESGTLTLRQEGRADSIFHGINLTIARNENAVTISGTIEDAAWGKWTATGGIPSGADKPGKLTFRTVTPHAVNPELLRQVPFVNPNAWTHVRLEGTTPAQFDLIIEPATENVSYRVALQPTKTTVEIPSVGLTVADAAGQLVAEGSVVTLTDVRGKAADGEVRVDSRMDFAGADNSMQFKADLKNLDVRKLPKTWQFPPEIDGRLSGQIDFTVHLPAEGGTRVTAVGNAKINDAKFRGQKVPPIELNDIQTTEGGLRFAERRTPASKEPPAKQPDAVKAKTGTGKPPGLVSTALTFAAKVVKPADAPKEERAYLNLNIMFRDVDLAELLKTAGFEAPLKVGGKVTVSVKVEIPTETPDEFKAYRMTGTISSRSVTFDDLAIEDIAAKLSLRDGKLSVSDFVGRLPALGGDGVAGGVFRAQGELEIGQAYPFKASVKIEQVALEHVERLTSLLPESLRLAGEATATATVEGTLSPLSLKSNGQARVVKLRIGSVPADDLTFRWDSDDDAIRFHDAAAKLFGGDISGQLEIPFKADVAGTGALKLDNLDLGELSKTLLASSNLKLEGKAAGTLKVRSPAAGEGSSRVATAEVDLQAPSMKLQGIPAKKIKGAATYGAGVLKYVLTGEALGGSFEVAGQYPPEPKKTPPKLEGKKDLPKKDGSLDLGRIKLKNIQLSGLWDVVGLKSTLGPLDAEISGDLPLTTDADGRLVGNGRLWAERLRWNGKSISGAGQATVRLTAGAMTFEEVLLFIGEGIARARITIDRSDPDRSEMTLSLSNVPSSRLLFLFPELATRFDMMIDGRFTTTMGREWRGSGVLTSSRGKIYGVPVTDVRVPIDWTANPGRGRSQIRVRDATATAAGGQMTAKAEVSLFNDLPPRLVGDVSFRNVNLSQAFRDGSSVAGNLLLTGKLDFSADQLRTADDLTAKLDGKLGESQPFSLPVLSAVMPYLGLGQNTSTTIREGEVHAMLGKSVWRVQKFTLSGPSLDLHADGTMSTAGRLNLAVTASSRQRPSQALMRRFTPATTLAANPTQALGPTSLTSAISFIGNYTVYLEVTGTVDQPEVRLQTLRTLSEGAVRFFLFRFLAPFPGLTPFLPPS